LCMPRSTWAEIEPWRLRVSATALTRRINCALLTLLSSNSSLLCFERLETNEPCV
jgi:hypothetical protein